MSSHTDAMNQWLERVLGVRAAASGGPVSGASGAGAADGLAAWRQARAQAIAQLQALERGIAQMQHPRRDAAIILVRAIQKNLTPEPKDPRAVAELRRYLESDDIIREAEAPNGFGVNVALRAPLLAALQAASPP